MKIYVFNLKRFLNRTRIVCVPLAILLVECITFTLVVRSYARQNEDIETSSVNDNTVIVLDAGHGGEDPGATGTNGKYEKDINLEVTMLLGEALREKGYTVVYTRTEDKMLYKPEENVKGMRKISDLKNRCAIANENESCILVSIHMNSYGASKYSGLQVYYNNEDPNSRKLADSVQSNVRENLQNDNNRAIKDGSNLFLLENCNGTAILIECGFLSNAEECEKLSQKEYQKQLSFAIVCGIIEYIEANTSN